MDSGLDVLVLEIMCLSYFIIKFAKRLGLLSSNAQVIVVHLVDGHQVLCSKTLHAVLRPDVVATSSAVPRLPDAKSRVMTGF